MERNIYNYLLDRDNKRKTVYLWVAEMKVSRWVSLVVIKIGREMTNPWGQCERKGGKLRKVERGSPWWPAVVIQPKENELPHAPTARHKRRPKRGW